MASKQLLFTVIITALTTTGIFKYNQSDWSSISSEHRLLAEMTILSVGSVSKEEYTNYQNYKKIEWYEYKESYSTDLCFVMPNYIGLWGYGDQPVMIVQDKSKNYWLAIFNQQVGSIAVDIEAFQVIDCPNL